MNAILVAGLGFGDEGKGSIVDSLTRKHRASLVVRYNGGAQAAHHVVTDDGREHCFSQWGSGTLAGAMTYLSRFMMIDPLNLANEAAHLEEIGVIDPWSMLMVHPDAPILTPYHRALNRLREISRGDQRHGSCGLGIGELGSDMAHGLDVLRAKHIWHTSYQKDAIGLLCQIQERLLMDANLIEVVETEHTQSLKNILRTSPAEWLVHVSEFPIAPLTSELCGPDDEVVIFEGAQGVLLDEWHGFHPYTTYSNCTFENAVELLADSNVPVSNITRIGVTRTYATRHGAGPFPSEQFEAPYYEKHNTAGAWQNAFRFGRLDIPLLRYAIAVLNGIDQLALTCADHFQSCGVVVAYNNECMPKLVLHHDLIAQEQMGVNLQHVKHSYIENAWSIQALRILLETQLQTPIGIISHGPTANDKEYLGVTV